MSPLCVTYIYRFKTIIHKTLETQTATCSQQSARERLRPEVHDLVNRRKQVNQPQWYALLFVPGPGEQGCWSHLNKHRGRTDRLINATSFRWMAHLFVHHRLPVLLSLPTALFFKLYLFCSTVYIRSTCGIQAVGTTVIIHVRVSEDLAIADVDQKTSLPSCQETDRKWATA